jgi:hypothetical protein
MVATQKLAQGLQARLGSFAALKITDVSYYPTETVQERIKLAVYGYHPEGIGSTEKWLNEDNHVLFYRPLSHTQVVGELHIFLPQNGHPFVMMQLEQVNHRRRADIKLSIVSPLALAPHRLHMENWGNGYTSFYVVDKEGSKWSIHCEE